MLHNPPKSCDHVRAGAAIQPRRRKLLSLLTVLSITAGSLLLSRQPSAYAQPQGIEVNTQVSVPVTESAAAARTQALADAMQQALEQAVTQAAPESRGRLYLVNMRAREFVTGYRVLEEGEASGIFTMRIEAQVDLPRLLRALQSGASSVRKLSAKRVAIGLCATPTRSETATQAAFAAQTQARAFLADKVETIEMLPPVRCQNEQPGLLDSGQVPLHSVLMLTLDEEVTTHDIRGTLPALVGAQARVQWRVLSREGGTSSTPVLQPAEASAFAETKAAAQAAAYRDAAQKGLTQLLSRPGVLPASGHGVLITLEGLSGFARYQQAVRALAALPGVTQAEPRRFVPATDKGPPQQQILLHTSVSAESLGALLGRTPLAGLQAQVMPQPGNALRVLLVETNELPVALPPPPAGAESEGTVEPKQP